LVTTDLHRFYSLFDDRQLIGDLFMICEDARVDAHLKTQYKGLQSAYETIQHRALERRPDLKSLPLRESLMEVLVQVSLDRRAALEVPEALYESVLAALDVLDELRSEEASVEDAAEGALRLYQVIHQVPNYEQDPGEQQQELSPEQQQRQQPQQRSTPSRLPGGSMARVHPKERTTPEQAYHSPQKLISEASSNQSWYRCWPNCGARARTTVKKVRMLDSSNRHSKKCWRTTQKSICLNWRRAS
jgi:hypothetical protein